MTNKICYECGKEYPCVDHKYKTFIYDFKKLSDMPREKIFNGVQYHVPFMKLIGMKRNNEKSWVNQTFYDIDNDVYTGQICVEFNRFYGDIIILPDADIHKIYDDILLNKDSYKLQCNDRVIGFGEVQKYFYDKLTTK